LTKSESRSNVSINKSFLEGIIVDKKELQGLYLGFLRDEGYKGELDDDGDISFKYEGGFYYIFVDAEDEKYFHMVCPYFWKLEEEEEKLKALRAVNLVNRQYKCGKLFLIKEEKNVTADIGVFFNDVSEFKVFFYRLIGIIQAMVNDFVEEMKK
jgi:hypothetical protein